MRMDKGGTTQTVGYDERPRAIVMQKKTERRCFEVTEQTREVVSARHRLGKTEAAAVPSRVSEPPLPTTRR